MTNPWQAPEGVTPSAGASVLGFVSVLVLHGAIAGGLVWSESPFAATWLDGFGVLQLGFVAPLTAALVWAGAPRATVIGVFAASALVFLLNAAWWARLLGGA